MEEKKSNVWVTVLTIAKYAITLILGAITGANVSL